MKKVFDLNLLITAILMVVFLSCQQDIDRITDISVEPTEKTLKEGEEFVIKVKITPDNAKNRSVTWQSDNTDVAKVDEKGKVTAIKEGTAVIKVKTQDGNKTAECKVIVSKSFDPNCVINGIKFEFVEISGGTFTMGSPDNEVGRNNDESPQHVVTLNSFYMGKYEVTQAQWKAVMETDTTPSFFKGDNLPVEMVNYADIMDFITKLNELTKKEYRLSTEAEWEYACRAGTTTPFYTGNNITTAQANYNGVPYNDNPKGEYRGKTTEVGSFAPNAFGLYDMHGNVWEWCSDKYGKYPDTPQVNPTGATDGSYGIIRGGSWDNGASYCRSAFRASTPFFMIDNFLGFRLVHPKK
ncbi:MAG: SUMF1/EgtB/PvdO family nonheme iron enzyme [Porphyromonadaceae bacterium]|nr:SUMF1/EgtB/PvdO family nonheme iron enzyme [Porphyromonadaceae bacterium]